MPAPTRRARATLLLATAALAAAGCGRTPQIGGDGASLKAVDALYTAVGLRDPKLVDRCEAGLKSLHAAGKLPDDARDALARIVAEARAGGWEGAQNHLGAFMEAQRK